MKNYYVYVKDHDSHTFWTVHVTGLDLKEIFSYAKMRMLGGDAFGVKDFGWRIPEGFCHGNVEPGMKGF